MSNEVKVHGSHGDGKRLNSPGRGPGVRVSCNRNLHTAQLARFVVAHAGCGGAIEPLHEIRAGDRVLAFRCGGCGAREHYDPVLAAVLRRRERKL